MSTTDGLKTPTTTIQGPAWILLRETSSGTTAEVAIKDEATGRTTRIVSDFDDRFDAAIRELIPFIESQWPGTRMSLGVDAMRTIRWDSGRAVEMAIDLKAKDDQPSEGQS